MEKLKKKCQVCKKTIHLKKNLIESCNFCGFISRKKELKQQDYKNLLGRNIFTKKYINEKIENRINYLRKFDFKKKLKILDFGCAEGTLGGELKKISNWCVHGLEVSKDRLSAKTKLDKVYSSIDYIKQKYDLVLFFHVIEHLPNLKIFSKISSLLRYMGAAVIEVPNHSGNICIKYDRNEEHNFSFTVLSTAILAKKNNLEMIDCSVGNFESPAYSDCLRICLQKKSDYFKYKEFLKSIKNVFKKKIIIFGVGGDYKKYIYPIINKKHIAGYYFNPNHKTPNYINKKLILSTLQTKDCKSCQILVCSLKYEGEIIKYLEFIRWPKSKMILLSNLLNIRK